METNVFNGLFTPLVERKADITRFCLNPCELGKWLHQNHGEPIDRIEGCLLDSLLIATKKGYAAIYEHYVNPNMSDYLIEFEPYPGSTVTKKWQAFSDSYYDD